MGADATRALAAQDALVALLEVVLSADYHIDLGWPQEWSEHEAFVDDDFSWSLASEETWSGVSSLAQDETLSLTAYLYVRRVGASSSEIRNAVFAGVNLVVAALRADPTISGAVSFAALSAGEYKWSFADTEGRSREGQVKLTVTCTAFSG